jgi:hypothetical protein
MTDAEVKQDLKIAVGTAVYGVKAFHDYEGYEIMVLLKEIMNEVESPQDFFR